MRAIGIVLGSVALSTAVAQASESFEGWRDTSRRDPFDYGGGNAAVVGPRRPPPPKPPVPPPPPRRKTVEHVLRDVSEGLPLAHQLLTDREYGRAVGIAGDLVREMRVVGIDDRDEYEEVVRLHETAVRLQRRAAIEEYLTKKNIDLQGIVWDEASPVVLIGGKILREGDSIEDVTIESIGRHEVILMKDGVRLRKTM